MCQHCQKQQTSHLSRKVPDPKDLDKLDTFDLAFMIMTGYVKAEDPLQALALVTKAADVLLWGPQAAVMGLTMRKAWRKHGADIAKQIRDCFDLSGDISVDRAKLRKIFKTKKFKRLGKKLWRSMRSQVNNVLEATAAKSTRHHEKQLQEAEKVEVLKIDDEELERLLQASAATIQAYVEQFPQGIYRKRVEELLKQAAKKPSARNVDQIQLANRIKAIPKAPVDYLNNLSDVETGRIWNHTAIQVAREQRIRTYTIISEEDNNVCPVCTRVHGKQFDVRVTYRKVQRFMDSAGDTDAMARIFPFPRVNDVDNLPPEDFEHMGLLPPLHGRCRCDIIYLF